MRIAVLILGLILGIVMVLQSVLVTGFSGMAGDEASGTAGLGGIMMAVLWLIACALVIPVPLVSAVAFAMAAYVGFTFAKDFGDLRIWAMASIVLAVLSVIGWIGKRRGERKEAKRHRELLAAVTAVPAPLPVPANQATGSIVSYCSQCGTGQSATAQFCAQCGARL